MANVTQRIFVFVPLKRLEISITQVTVSTMCGLHVGQGDLLVVTLCLILTLFFFISI